MAEVADTDWAAALNRQTRDSIGHQRALGRSRTSPAVVAALLTGMTACCPEQREPLGNATGQRRPNLGCGDAAAVLE